jgi:hypothetical protein
VSGPIPKAHLDGFLAALDFADDDDLPDGAWFAVLEDAARSYMKRHKIRGDANSAVHQWVEARSQETTK